MNFPDNEYFFPSVSESSRLLVGCRREDYSASRLAHAVEDCDAHLINLNVTSFTGERPSFSLTADGSEPVDPKFPVMVDLRVSHRNAEAITRSLERYGYTVLEVKSTDEVNTDLSQERLEHLWRYLNT